ncbi:unnamed protein product [Caenorhabditis auriculariae]|uniref:LEM domain-containing protein n=1 Tax=Caenorhabditis auriculariae TaxID=2777116 RepID=A0A8S1HDV7_9PELO|nr:unnamed protein product [Caenorhabditis auriculariae]
MGVDVENLSDAELKEQLKSHGVNVGPIVGTTRSIFEKKLRDILSGKVKPNNKPVSSNSSESSKPTSVRQKASSSSASSQSSSVPRKVVSEEEESDEDDEPIVSPSFTPNTTNKPVTSTPESFSTPDSSDNSNATSSYRHTAISEKRGNVSSSTARQEVLESRQRIDRPGATPPRNKTLRTPFVANGSPKSKHAGESRVRTSVIASYTSPKHPVSSRKILSTPGIRTMHDLGSTTAEEDDDEEDGIESNRVIYTSDASDRQNFLGRTWDRVLGYDFKTSSKPGERYDFRVGGSRTSVIKDPRTGKYIVKQTKAFSFSDALRICLITLCVLFGVLVVAYAITNQRESVKGFFESLKSAFRDTFNLFYRYTVLPALVSLFAVLLACGAFFGYKKYKEECDKEEDARFELIDRILKMIEDSSKEGVSYISQPHVRDVLFPPSRRRKTELARWEKAVAFIDTNESRVATEVRVLPNGHECAVWKWIGRRF